MAVLVLFVALLGASPAAAWSIAGVKKAAAPNPAAAPPEPEKQQPETVGSKTYHPSFGLFSKGCKYRVVTSAADDSHSAHEFWDEDRNAWVAERTPGCFHTGHPAPGPPSFGFNGGSPRTAAASSDKHHTLIENLWYNNGRWYLLADGDTPVAPVRLSRNQETRVLHVANATRWLDAVSWRVVPGDTVFFDFVFFTHPTAIGHWWEMLGPLYSSLKRLSYRRPCDQFLLLHLKRRHLMEWVRAMIAVALGVPIKGHLPPIIMQVRVVLAVAAVAVAVAAAVAVPYPALPLLPSPRLTPYHPLPRLAPAENHLNRKTNSNRKTNGPPPRRRSRRARLRRLRRRLRGLGRTSGWFSRGLCWPKTCTRAAAARLRTLRTRGSSGEQAVRAGRDDHDDG